MRGDFWQRVDKDGPVPEHRPALGQCWLWRGWTRNGYGVVRWEGRRAQAHRIAFVLLRGPIGDGLTLDHLCRVRACVRPDHMEAVDLRTNILRGGGPAALNARKLVCLRGHPLEGENLYVGPQGARVCRACKREEERRRRARAA